MKIQLTLLSLVLSVTAGAADLTRGTTFVDGQRLTASDLHGLIDNTSIGNAFYTGKSAQGTLASGDYFLLYSPSALGYLKMTASAVLYANTTLITVQPEKTTPSTNDYVLLYDSTGTVLKKATVANLGLNSTNQIAWQPEITNLLSSAYFLTLNGGTNNKVTASNLFWSLETWNKPFTNLLTHTAPTNQDRLLIWDGAAGTNKQTTLVGLVTNLPAAIAATNTDVFLSVRAGTGVVQQVTLAQILTLVSNLVVLPNITNTYTVAEFAVPAVNTAVTNTHTLGATPTSVRWVLLCKTAELGYVQGDEVDAWGPGYWNSDDETAFDFWANPTNVGCIRGTTQIELKQRSGGSKGDASPITAGNWRMKAYLKP